MNIVITNHNDLIFKGIAGAIAVIESNTVLWDAKVKPPYDMCNELRPDLLVCTALDLTPSLVRVIDEYNIRVILFGLSNVIKPLVSCLPQNTTEVVLSNVDNYVITKPMANVAQYNNGKVSDLYSSDILYVSNTTNVEILSILSRLTKYKLKICGNLPVPLANYVGKANVKTISNLIASAKIVLDYNENILYDAAHNKAFCLSNVQNDLYPIYTSDNLLEQVDHFLNDEKHREYYTKKAANLAKGRSYYSLLHDICIKAGLTDLATLTEKYL